MERLMWTYQSSVGCRRRAWDRQGKHSDRLCWNSTGTGDCSWVPYTRPYLQPTSHTIHRLSRPWAPAGMARGHLPPRKYCKVLLCCKCCLKSH